MWWAWLTDKKCTPLFTVQEITRTRLSIVYPFKVVVNCISHGLWCEYLTFYLLIFNYLHIYFFAQTVGYGTGDYKGIGMKTSAKWDATDADRVHWMTYLFLVGQPLTCMYTWAISNPKIKEDRCSLFVKYHIWKYQPFKLRWEWRIN